MRTAYSGRAAAYEKKGAMQQAHADHNMVVLYYALEVEILNGQEAPDRGKLLAEAADAYRARSKCLEALGRQKAAQVDRKRADGLEADAKKLAREAPKSPEATAARIQVTNGWNEPVTLVIGGVSYRLDIGEQKAIPAATASVAYEMQAGTYRKTGTLQAGKTYSIQVSPR